MANTVGTGGTGASSVASAAYKAAMNKALSKTSILGGSPVNPSLTQGKNLSPQPPAKTTTSSSSSKSSSSSSSKSGSTYNADYEKSMNDLFNQTSLANGQIGQPPAATKNVPGANGGGSYSPYPVSGGTAKSTSSTAAKTQTTSKNPIQTISQTPKSVAKPVSAAQQQEIARKAAAGTPLADKSNPTANALYESYKAAAAKTTAAKTPAVKTPAGTTVAKTPTTVGSINAQAKVDAAAKAKAAAKPGTPAYIKANNDLYTAMHNSGLTPTGTKTPATTPTTPTTPGAQTPGAQTPGASKAPSALGAPDGNLTPEQKAYFDKHFGGFDQYVSNQQKRYADTQDPNERAALEADAKHLGYSLGGTGGASDGGGSLDPNADVTPNEDGKAADAVDHTYDTMTNSGQIQEHNDLTDSTNHYADSADPNSPFWDGIRDDTDHLGTKQYLEQKQAYQAWIDNLMGSQKTDMDAINNNLMNDQNQLSDKTFQDWMSARQGLAGRGLTGVGAGFQQDADTRLQMNQQNALGSLFAAAQQNIGKTQADYREQLQDAYTKQAGNLETDAQKAQFKDMYEMVSKNTTEMAKMYAQMVGNQLPYSETSSHDLLNNQQFYDNLDQQDKQFYAQLKQNYNIAIMQYMGKDPATGALTLDAKRLNEDIANNKRIDDRSKDALVAQILDNAEKNHISASGVEMQGLGIQTQLSIAKMQVANSGKSLSPDFQVKWNAAKTKFDAWDTQLRAKQGALKPGETLPDNDPTVVAWRAALADVVQVGNDSMAAQGK